MTHNCIKCGHQENNNSSIAKEPCSKCLGREFRSEFDEEVEDGSGVKQYFLNVHTCLNCRESYYNLEERMHTRCGCGCTQFNTKLGESEFEYPTICLHFD
jgi:predicted  nucleic acid-binding Zn-ribbon protein